MSTADHLSPYPTCNTHVGNTHVGVHDSRRHGAMATAAPPKLIGRPAAQPQSVHVDEAPEPVGRLHLRIEPPLLKVALMHLLRLPPGCSWTDLPRGARRGRERTAVSTGSPPPRERRSLPQVMTDTKQTARPARLRPDAAPVLRLHLPHALLCKLPLLGAAPDEDFAILGPAVLEKATNE